MTKEDFARYEKAVTNVVNEEMQNPIEKLFVLSKIAVSILIENQIDPLAFNEDIIRLHIEDMFEKGERS